MGFRISTAVGSLSIDLVCGLKLLFARACGNQRLPALPLTSLDRTQGDVLGTHLIETKKLEPARRGKDHEKLKNYSDRGGAVGLWQVRHLPMTSRCQLKWVSRKPSSRAITVRALKNGFYEEEGLECYHSFPVVPTLRRHRFLAGGGADVNGGMDACRIGQRAEKGPANGQIFAQPFKSSGMMLTCRKDAGRSKP